MRFKISILLFLLAAATVTAQMRKWTLEECVIYALENNITIDQFEFDLENARDRQIGCIGKHVTRFKCPEYYPGQYRTYSGSYHQWLCIRHYFFYRWKPYLQRDLV